MCVGDPVVVVGGGNSAGQAALFLSRRASKVSLLIRGDDLAKSMSRYLADRIEQDPKVDVLHHTEVRELVGKGAVEINLVAQDLTTYGWDLNTAAGQDKNAHYHENCLYEELKRTYLPVANSARTPIGGAIQDTTAFP